MTPITSMLPPLFACIAILSSASAEMRTLHGGTEGQAQEGVGMQREAAQN